MRWTLCALLVTFAAEGVRPQQAREERNLNEGSSCEMTNGGRGVCRLLTECPGQLAMLHGTHRHRPQICSFRETTPIVCCGVTAAWSPNSDTPSGPSPPQSPARPLDAGREPFQRQQALPTPSSSQMSTPSSALPPSAPPPATAAEMQMRTANATTVGERSNRACKEYSREVSKIFFPLINSGEGTQPGDFPHMALLGYKLQGQTNLTWRCAGTLISRRFVVTAAHCFSDRMLRAPVRVRLGEHDLDDDNDSVVEYGITRSVIHPQYSARSWYHDLALIELDREVVFNRYIQPACLWTRPQDPTNGLIITGWGGTQQDGNMLSRTLLKGNGTLTRVEPNMCVEFYRVATTQLRQGIQDGMLCAVDNTGMVDTCEGDSGGPIQVPASEGVAYKVVGVTSGGSRVCGSRVPSIYTRLFTYLDWIETVVWPDN